MRFGASQARARTNARANRHRGKKTTHTIYARLYVMPYRCFDITYDGCVAIVADMSLLSRGRKQEDAWNRNRQHDIRDRQTAIVFPDGNQWNLNIDDTSVLSSHT